MTTQLETAGFLPAGSSSHKRTIHMMSTKAIGVALAVTIALVPTAAVAQDDARADGAELLMVISGTDATVVDDVLTLTDVPAVIYFSDRPERIAGHWDVDRLEALWQEGGFDEDPPNADLSFLSDDEPANAVVELLSVSVDGDDVSFDISVIEGDVPDGVYGSASLFIDPTRGDGTNAT